MSVLTHTVTCKQILKSNNFTEYQIKTIATGDNSGGVVSTTIKPGELVSSGYNKIDARDEYFINEISIKWDMITGPANTTLIVNPYLEIATWDNTPELEFSLPVEKSYDGNLLITPINKIKKLVTLKTP